MAKQNGVGNVIDQKIGVIQLIEWNLYWKSLQRDGSHLFSFWCGLYVQLILMVIVGKHTSPRGMENVIKQPGVHCSMSLSTPFFNTLVFSDG